MKVSHAVMGAALLATAATLAVPQCALAQPVAVYDPAQLPATRGQVQQYSLTPRGGVDGLILKDGTQVHLPPRLGTQLVAIVKPGDTVVVHGLKAQSLPLIKAMSVTVEGTNKTVTDAIGPNAGPGGRAGERLNGAPGGGAPGGRWSRPDGERQMQTAEGRIKQPLYGPRGDLNGVLLEDGTQVHLPPPRAQAMSQDLKPGNMLVVQGFGTSSVLGRSIEARKIGPSADKLVEIGGPPRSWAERPGPGHWRHQGPPPSQPAPEAAPASPPAPSKP